jgi:rfaE bifunctional protein kinase chain/domain
MKLNAKNKKIAVVGDLMLDRYIFGQVNRISPEAPVPVVEVTSEYTRFGGSANVCLNIASLGATAIPFGVIGSDDYGQQFLDRAKENKIDVSHVTTVQSRPTTVKTRVVSGSQQIVRIDREVKTDISDADASALVASFSAAAADLDAVIFQDYNKGVITKQVIQDISAICQKQALPVFVDPKFSNFFEYKNSFLFKPNKRELSDALGRELRLMDDYKSAMIELKKKNQAKHILLTLSAEGMLLLSGEADFFHTPTMAAEVADVSGAGDTVIATLVSAYVSGLSVEDSVILANKAAGIVIRELGIVPIRLDQL